MESYKPGQAMGKGYFLAKSDRATFDDSYCKILSKIDKDIITIAFVFTHFSLFD